MVYQQLEDLNSYSNDLESIKIIANKLNDHVKHLYITTQPSSDSKYLTKIKSDIHEMNQKIMTLKHYITEHEHNCQVNVLIYYFSILKIPFY